MVNFSEARLQFDSPSLEFKGGESIRVESMLNQLQSDTAVLQAIMCEVNIPIPPLPSFSRISYGPSRVVGLINKSLLF